MAKPTAEGAWTRLCLSAVGDRLAPHTRSPAVGSKMSLRGPAGVRQKLKGLNCSLAKQKHLTNLQVLQTSLGVSPQSSFYPRFYILVCVFTRPGYRVRTILSAAAAPGEMRQVKHIHAAPAECISFRGLPWFRQAHLLIWCVSPLVPTGC